MSWLSKINPNFHPFSLDRIVMVGKATSNEDWIEPDRIIYDHQLVLFPDTTFVVCIEDVPYKCRPGSFIIIPPGVRHLSYNDSDKPGMRRWLHFDWEYRDNPEEAPAFTYLPGAVKTEHILPAPDFVPRKIFFGKISNPDKIYQLHEEIRMKRTFGSPHDRAVARGMLLAILSELLDESSKEIPVTRYPKVQAGTIRHVLEEQAQKPMHDSALLEDLFKPLGLSYVHICRLFKKAYGLSPGQYVRSYRIERARLLLQDTSLRIDHISEACGFESPAYFSKVFRAKIGMTPSEYRNQV